VKVSKVEIEVEAAPAQDGCYYLNLAADLI
jgi:hypothetical protein